MAITHVWIVPLIAFLIVPVSFFISYGVAVSEGHVDALWPFISDTITFAPESCFFGELLNIGAIFIGLTVYLRHRQIVQFYGHGLQREGRTWRVVSTIFLWIGLLSAFGTSMVANFQESRLLIGHLIGAFLAFILGLVYGWGQTIFSYAMRPRMTGLIISHLRLILSTLGTVFFFTMMGAGFVKRSQEHAKHRNGTHYIHYDPNSPGYTGHLVGTFSEWLMVICFMLFILSFAIELRHAKVIAPKLTITGKLAEHLNTEQQRLRPGGPGEDFGFGTAPSNVAAVSNYANA